MKNVTNSTSHFTGFVPVHGKPGKSWNLRISFSRPGKSWKMIIINGKLIIAVVKARLKWKKDQFIKQSEVCQTEVVNLFKLELSYVRKYP